MLRHLLPNCLPPLIVIAALQVASAISLEATLSFLGLGLPVTEPSLGLLIANGFQYLLSGKYWISFFPGLALLLTVVAINLVADQLRDVLNPRLQGGMTMDCQTGRWKSCRTCAPHFSTRGRRGHGGRRRLVLGRRAARSWAWSASPVRASR